MTSISPFRQLRERARNLDEGHPISRSRTVEATIAKAEAEAEREERAESVLAPVKAELRRLSEALEAENPAETVWDPRRRMLVLLKLALASREHKSILDTWREVEAGVLRLEAERRQREQAEAAARTEAEARAETAAVEDSLPAIPTAFSGGSDADP